MGLRAASMAIDRSAPRPRRDPAIRRRDAPARSGRLPCRARVPAAPRRRDSGSPPRASPPDAHLVAEAPGEGQALQPPCVGIGDAGRQRDEGRNQAGVGDEVVAEAAIARDGRAEILAQQRFVVALRRDGAPCRRQHRARVRLATISRKASWVVAGIRKRHARFAQICSSSVKGESEAGPPRSAAARAPVWSIRLCSTRRASAGRNRPACAQETRRPSASP